MAKRPRGTKASKPKMTKDKGGKFTKSTAARLDVILAKIGNAIGNALNAEKMPAPQNPPPEDPRHLLQHTRDLLARSEEMLKQLREALAKTQALLCRSDAFSEKADK